MLLRRHLAWPAALLVLLGALAVLGFVAAARAAPQFPPLSGRVVDQAGLLSADVEARIAAKLEELERRTTTQLVVVTLPSLQGHDIADYGYRLGRAWGIGQRGSNNGALLIVAPNERKVRIEVGYGLEGRLTDAVSRLIIDNAILPRFRAGDFAGGIERAVDDLVQVLSGDAEDFKRRAAERGRPGGPDLIPLIFTIVVITIWLIIFLRMSRRSAVRGRRRRSAWWGPAAGGGWGSGGWGGRSGGGGGGFSGGGGSFGGGGSSGSW